MVRRDEAERMSAVSSVSRCIFPVDGSSTSVSNGAPSSRPQASKETLVAQAGCRKPLRRKQARGPQHQVKPAASTHLHPKSRAAHVTAKAILRATDPEVHARAILAGYGEQHACTERCGTREARLLPPSVGRAGSYKSKTKSSGAQRESEGIVVLRIAATNNAAGGKGLCGGSVERAATCEGVTGKTGSNYPAGPASGVQVRHPRQRLGLSPSREFARGVMRRSERPLGKPCAGNPHARFKRGSCPHPAALTNWRQ
jgi:hypothetical protein